MGVLSYLKDFIQFVYIILAHGGKNNHGRLGSGIFFLLLLDDLETFHNLIKGSFNASDLVMDIGLTVNRNHQNLASDLHQIFRILDKFGPIGNYRYNQILHLHVSQQGNEIWIEKRLSTPNVDPRFKAGNVVNHSLVCVKRNNFLHEGAVMAMVPTAFAPLATHFTSKITKVRNLHVDLYKWGTAAFSKMIVYVSCHTLSDPRLDGLP